MRVSSAPASVCENLRESRRSERATEKAVMQETGSPLNETVGENENANGRETGTETEVIEIERGNETEKASTEDQILSRNVVHPGKETPCMFMAWG